MRKPWTVETFEIGTFGTPSNNKMNYLVCGYGVNVGETARLDDAIKLMEKNIKKVGDIRIHEYATGKTWYFE